MSFDERKYNREWMRRKRSENAWQRAIDNGHCPVCSMLLKSTFHIRCPYLEEPPQTLDTNQTPT